MEFDKSKVYTALNADEVKIRSKGYFSDNLKNLSFAVEEEYSPAYGEIEEIKDSSYGCRFLKKGSYNYSLFYPIEEPKENRFRPYSNPDEMIEDFKKRYSSYGGWSGKENPIYNPMIWIKSKATGFRHLVTDYGDDGNCGHCNRSCIWIGSFSIGFKKLLDDYTYLDGSPCGIMEE